MVSAYLEHDPWGPAAFPPLVPSHRSSTLLPSVARAGRVIMSTSLGPNSPDATL